MHKVQSYRDCQAWKDESMQLNSSSNEACKMYDAAVKQMCTRQADPILGGVESTVNKMMEADPNFVMGHVYMKYMGISGGSVSTQPFSKIVETQWDQLSSMEQSHCKAVKYFGNGHANKACEQWESILVEYPKDYLSLKMLYETQIFLGKFEEQRKAVEQVLPFYKKDVDLEYGYILGMHAFSLEETNSYDAAEQKATQALDCDRHDAWATHSLAHVYEMTGRYNEGIDFMSSTQKDWEIITGLDCHIHWHTLLYYIEKGDIEGALCVYDENVGSKASHGMFELSDAVSTLYRLKMEGINVDKKRWNVLMDEITRHMTEHSWAFYDACIMLGLCGAQLQDQSKAFLKSIKDMASNVKQDSSDVANITKSVNQHICEAIMYFEAEEYDKAADLLLKYKGQIQDIGGSHAQRDVFYLLLIHAARNSHNEKHRKLAKDLLLERKVRKDTPLTQRILSEIPIFSKDPA